MVYEAWINFLLTAKMTRSFKDKPSTKPSQKLQRNQDSNVLSFKHSVSILSFLTSTEQEEYIQFDHEMTLCRGEM